MTNLMTTTYNRREGEARWESILSNFDRPLRICDLDFTDLQQEEEEEDASEATSALGIPLPPPPPVPPPPAAAVPPPPPPLSLSLSLSTGPQPPPMPAPPPIGDDGRPRLVPKKHRKTVKLFWKEIRTLPPVMTTAALPKSKSTTVWDELEPTEVDSSVIEYLFESRAKESAAKSDQIGGLGTLSAREIVVLDQRRSNAINIGLTKLPPPRIIRQAREKKEEKLPSKLICLEVVKLSLFCLDLVKKKTVYLCQCGNLSWGFERRCLVGTKVSKVTSIFRSCLHRLCLRWTHPSWVARASRSS